MTMQFFTTSVTFWSNLSRAFILKLHARITLLISHKPAGHTELRPSVHLQSSRAGMVLNGWFEPKVPNDWAKVKRPGSAERAAPGSLQSWEALGEERDLRERPSTPAVGAKTTCSLQDKWVKEM